MKHTRVAARGSSEENESGVWGQMGINRNKELEKRK